MKTTNNLRLIQALCNQCNVLYKDIYIDYNNNCGDGVVDIFAGYVEDFRETWDNLRREDYG